MTVNETRLDNTISYSEVAIDGYTVVRWDRSRQEGDVAIYMYICNTIDFKIRNDLFDEDFEFLCLEIRKQKVKPFLTSVWHRPPNSMIDLLMLETSLDKIESENIESNLIHALSIW